MIEGEGRTEGHGAAATSAESGGRDGESGTAGASGDTLEEHEPVAEQESAAAMDADVPQPPGASQTTEGQPS